MITLSWLDILLIALICSVATLVVVSAWLKLFLLPKLQQSLLEQVTIQSEKTAEKIGIEVERAVRRGVVQGVSDLPSREVLEETTRAFARTGVELVGSGFGVMRKRKKSKSGSGRSEPGEKD